MRNRWKVLCMCLVLLAAVLLEPVSYARAEDEGTFDSEIPFLQGIEVELKRNNGFEWGLIFDELGYSKSIAFVDFEFDKLSGVDYSKYELVYDYELSSLLDDGTISTHSYTCVTEISKDSEPGFFDNILISLSIKDDYFQQSFAYLGIINKSSDFQQKSSSSLAIVKGLNTYNTVISKVDCYLREKSTGNFGLLSRFSFIWDSDFWIQKCIGISYELVIPETEEVLKSDGIQNSIFTDGFASDGDNEFRDFLSLFSRLYEFLIDVPSAIVAVITGFYNLAVSIASLFKVTFPFIPGLVFDAFGIILFVTPAVAIWIVLKGK